MDTIPAHYLDDELMGSPTSVPEPPADDTHSLDGPHGEEQNGGDGVSEQNMEKPDKSWMSAKRSPPHATVGENFPLHPDQNEPVQHDGGKKRKGSHDVLDAGEGGDPFKTVSMPPPILSDRAIGARLRRVFVKRRDGSMLLDDSWNSMWLDNTPGGGREQLMAIFEKVGSVVERGYLKNIPSNQKSPRNMRYHDGIGLC